MHNDETLSVNEGEAGLTGELGVPPDTTNAERLLVNAGFTGERRIPADTTRTERLLLNEGEAGLTSESSLPAEEELFVIADVDDQLYEKIVGAASINVVVCLLAARCGLVFRNSKSKQNLACILSFAHCISSCATYKNIL